MVVIYQGMKDLNSIEKQEIKGILETADNKIQKEVFGAKLLVDVNKKSKAGNRAKYSVHLRLDHPSLMFSAEEAEWELVKALHKSVDNLMEQVWKKGKKTVMEKKIPKIK